MNKVEPGHHCLVAMNVGNKFPFPYNNNKQCRTNFLARNANESMPGGDPKNIEVDVGNLPALGQDPAPALIEYQLYIYVGRWHVVVYGTINLLLSSGSYIHTAFMQLG